ncbi:MAG: response regulator transcription factor [Clostridiales bacterium]|nr:response regulator transcription factor [Clostridiales bacterium]
MKYKVAICDDDAQQREYIRGIVSAWFQKHHHLAEIRLYEEARPFLFDYQAEKDFDLLLLDVEMPKISGVELAKEVRKDNDSVQIVFITGFYEYFSDGFDVSALHYLIKPVDEEKLYPVLEKAVSNLSWRQRSVLISTPELDVKVPLSEILYVEADKVYVIVHTLHGVYRTRIALAKFAEQLDDTFLKVHRSFVVGLKHVQKIARTEITLLNGDSVPISRGMYDAVHAAMIRYL